MLNPGNYLGKYRVLACLSKTSICSVYKAESIYGSTEPVSIQLWENIHLSNAEGRQAFLQEAQALAQLQHSSIHAILDYGLEQDMPYIITPCPGLAVETLRERLNHQPSPGLREALNIITQIGDALAYAHRNRVVHGRLRPEHILLTKQGEALLNFPLPSLPDPANPQQANAYQAPEQLKGNISKSKLSDQYALACIAREIFTGQPGNKVGTLFARTRRTLPTTVEQALRRATTQQPGDRYTDVEAFLQALLTRPVEKMSPRIFSQWHSGHQRNAGIPRQRPLWLKVGAIILLSAILLGIAMPLIIIYVPARAATISLTPLSQHQQTQYTITAVTGTPNASQHEVAHRSLSYTTPPITKTVNASGKGHQDAVSATGTLIFSNPGQVLRQITTQEIKYGDINIVTDVPFDLDMGGTVSVPAHVVQKGPVGNIPAHAMDGMFDIVDIATQQRITTVYGTNPQPFSGGQDGYDYTFVQQEDIDNTVSPLRDQLTTQGTNELKKMPKPNEILAHSATQSDIQCSPNVKTDHQASDRVAEFTVTVTETCQAEAYDPQQIQNTAIQWLKADKATQLGTHYRLIGDIMVTTPVIQQVDFSTHKIYISVNTEGIWSFQLDKAQQSYITHLIMGKPQADALKLLNSSIGVAKASISTTGFLGTAIPTTQEAIKFVIINVSGLQHNP
ncbi:serine/threonine protein kinase [Ktedonosporobacter rubrisoli]|uniref:non-specific serine/threonine protein kinase n=1 Tax=Ktedonosporobacter rubrisoli TaxID=2509675 RepID=A0A4P6JUT4_KTERU|nr:protein kinase [Ktedonosporobacter rubrisoli]QBD79072.1 serine/threonine protein kinase [Ktedonosporobacter rubrisoli]